MSGSGTAERPSQAERGILWRWFDAVEEAAHGDDSPDRPALLTIQGVAHMRARFADPDGGSCYPSQGTIAKRLGIKRDSVIAVDAWLKSSGLTKFIRFHPCGVKEHRLTLPAAVPIAGQPIDEQMSPEQDSRATGVPAGDPPGVPSDVPAGRHNLLPPTSEKEGPRGSEETSTPDLPASTFDLAVAVLRSPTPDLVEELRRDVPEWEARYGKGVVIATLHELGNGSSSYPSLIRKAIASHADHSSTPAARSEVLRSVRRVSSDCDICRGGPVWLDEEDQAHQVRVDPCPGCRATA